MSWQRFAAVDAIGLRPSYAACLLGRSVRDIERARRGVHRAAGASRDYAALFARWHGRPPEDREWPVPAKSAGGSYAWLPPEVAQLALLVGQFGVVHISELLTQRLRGITGDRRARRTPSAVQSRIQLIGLQAGDVVGGLTVQEAGSRIGSEQTVRTAIASGDLVTSRIGRRLVISLASWDRWLQGRVLPPTGYVHLASLRVPLGIRSDAKLPEFATEGLIPTAVRCTPPNGSHGTTRFGTWYVDPKVATRLIADRRAGRAMPWHGVPLRSNVRHTYQLWLKRRHPETCATCRSIWGPAGPASDFEAFFERYGQLAHGAKRHLTRTWSAGLDITELAKQAKVPVARVRRAVAQGLLTTAHAPTKVTRTDATRWMARGCPEGSGKTSWITLTQAKQLYRFTAVQLRAAIREGRLNAKTVRGSGRGVLVVVRQQCVEWREQVGYTEAQAAKLIGVSVVKLRKLLPGVNWRGTGAIPAVTVDAIIKRLKSSPGMTLPEAAKALKRPAAWIRARIQDGTVRVKRSPWDQRRQYLTIPMVDRLRNWKKPRRTAPTLSDKWIGLTASADLAGVSTATVSTWARTGELDSVATPNGSRYRRASVKARARRHWKTCRRGRRMPPEWLQRGETARGATGRSRRNLQ